MVKGTWSNATIDPWLPQQQQQGKLFKSSSHCRPSLEKGTAKTGLIDGQKYFTISMLYSLDPQPYNNQNIHLFFCCYGNEQKFSLLRNNFEICQHITITSSPFYVAPKFCLNVKPFKKEVYLQNLVTNAFFLI